MSVFGAREWSRELLVGQRGDERSWCQAFLQLRLETVQSLHCCEKSPALLSLLTVVPDGSRCQLQHWLLSACCLFGSLPVPLETEAVVH